MDTQIITSYFHQYGAIAIFIIVFLEYLNLPGFPAGLILPMAGIWAAQGGIGFGMALLLSVLAGLCGSSLLYFVGRLGGEFLLTRHIKKFPKLKRAIDQAMEQVKNKGYIGIFIGKLIPVIRTIIPIPAGILKMNFWRYTVFSVFGITIWNLVLVGAGYLLGDPVLQILSS
ncbi:DedA family protein [Anaerocolumna sp. MB42-C2]|uniref:DedA family protein n=1 Tax=Anaerocolumna sp. MB42-C2 TaxID=3070997 RepID=UPI0027E0B2E2|nr:DedA family protein [Anaerocolumna sp. MB42-C2]WMJ89894.1 DedA family protein [Anaerocolumna sp. MB42-C2]